MGYDKRYEKIKTAFLKRRIYLGLFLLLPIFFSVFTLASPVIFLTKFRSLLQRHALTVGKAELDMLYASAQQWTYIFAFVALIAGVIVAYSLVRPARRLLKEEKEYGDIEEFSALGKEFTKIAAYFRKYTSLLENMTGGIIAINHKNSITMANPYACLILKSRESDLVGKDINEIFDISKDIYLSMKGEIITSELNTEINGKKMSIGYTLSPIRGKDSIDGVILNFMDTTNIKEMYDEMRKTEKLASIGALAMDVAHEVRNPLASIKGLVQLIGEDMKDSDSKKAYVDTILKETDRLNRVVDAIFEKKRAPATSENLREVIHRILILCGQAMKDKHVKVTEEYDAEAGKIQIEDERLFHAIYNIILNAYEAVNYEGEVLIKTYITDKIARIEVCSDSEISSDIQVNRIFEADVTTKGPGRGLGLKIAGEAIKALGGSISVEAEKGKTKFTILLPVK